DEGERVKFLAARVIATGELEIVTGTEKHVGRKNPRWPAGPGSRQVGKQQDKSGDNKGKFPFHGWFVFPANYGSRPVRSIFIRPGAPLWLICTHYDTGRYFAGGGGENGKDRAGGRQ